MIANALINCNNGLMKLSFWNMTLEVNIFHVGKQPQEEDKCYHTYMIDSLIPEEAHTIEDSDSLEYLLRDLIMKFCNILLIFLMFLVFFFFFFMTHKTSKSNFGNHALRNYQVRKKN